MRFVVTLHLILCLAAVFWGCRDPGLDRGKAFLQLEDWPRSVASYDACVQKDPENAEARLGLALSRLGQVRERAQTGADSLEDWMRVVRDLAIVERLDSVQSTRDERADVLFRASQWLNKRSRPAQAERLARQAQLADPTHAASAQFLGNLARARGDLVQAERWYSRALDADSAYLPAYIGLGEMALADQDPEGAIVYWQMASRRDSGNVWLKTNLASLVDSMGLKSDR